MEPERWDYDRSSETPQERLDRNWSELLQELRVLQTGTQLLTGFLLTVAFQPVFRTLDPFERALYVVLVLLAAASTTLALGPVALHRALFRRRARADLVRETDRMLRAALAVVGLVIVGAVTLVVDVAVGLPLGIAAGAAGVVAIAILWIAHPLRRRREDPMPRAAEQRGQRRRSPEEEDPR